MNTTYYCFRIDTGRCVCTASGPVEPQDGIIVIQGEPDLDILTITFEVDDDGARIIPRPKPTEELVEEALGKKEVLMEEARRRIDILRDRAELNDDQQAADLLLQWRKYRLAVLDTDVSKPDAIVRPEKPLA